MQAEGLNSHTNTDVAGQKDQWKEPHLISSLKRLEENDTSASKGPHDETEKSWFTF